MDLKEVDLLGDDVATHWYYRAKGAALTHLLGPRPGARILDLGAGSGFFSRQLLARTTATEAWCVDTSYDADRDECESGKPIHYRRHLLGIEADLVLMMDVLEHVDDEAALLAAALEQAAPDARILISVPAFQWLWSPHDDFLGHRRRYTLEQLTARVEAHGLRVERAAYYYGLVLPLALVTRLAARISWSEGQSRSQLRRHHPLVNGLLAALCHAELPWFTHNRLAGLSVFCVARRP